MQQEDAGVERECPEYELHDNIGDFVITLMNLACETENFLEEAQQEEVREKVLELYFELRAFWTPTTAWMNIM